MRRLKQVGKLIMNSTGVNNDPYPFEDFAPTLSQCFVIVVIGYLMVKLEILTANDMKGVVSFASYFAMPGIICMSLADADFDDFRWELLFSVFLGKFFTFVAVAGTLILLDRNVGVAGTVAIFCTQSNDLPVGNPLMSSLYRDYRPQMMKYLFLIPAMTVMFFVPISNIMISVHRMKRNACGQEEDSDTKDYLWSYFQHKKHLNEIYGIMKNPVVIATVLGLVLNFAFERKMPKILHQPIKVAAETIPGIALAMLGFSFVRKERYLISSAVLPAAILLILKMVLTPILLHFILKVMTEESKSSKQLSDFVLLYGIMSPATAAFQAGQEFRKSLAVMSVALIITSFTCFPVSYVVARFTIAPGLKLSTYVPLLKDLLFWTACVSLCCDVIVCVLMLRKNQWRQVPSSYVIHLVFTQIITCCGVLLGSLKGYEAWLVYCQMALYYGGEISGYLWTGTLAVVLIFKEKYSMLTKNVFVLMSFTAFSVSALITSVMCILIPVNNVRRVYVVGRTRSNFEFLQLIVISSLLFISLSSVSACLVYHFKRRKSSSEITGVSAYEKAVFYTEKLEGPIKNSNKDPSSTEKVQEKLGESDEANIYYEEVLKNSGFDNSPSCSGRDWTFRMSGLLILLGLTMLVRFIANLFKLVHSEALEIMIPMEFLQAVLFIGQGIFILLTFGIDIRTIIISLRKWWRKKRYETDEPVVQFENSKGDIAQFCNQFHNFYRIQCFRDIANERRWKGTLYKGSFWGHQLVDWMISEGLCQDDTDAECHGQKLLAGGVIQHATQRHHFYNAPYLYHFTRNKQGQ